MKIFFIRVDYCELNIANEVLVSAKNAIALGDLVRFQNIDFDDYETLELFLQAYCALKQITEREESAQQKRNYVERFKELIK